MLADAPFGAQYADTGWFGVFMTFLMMAFVLVNIRRAHSGQDLFIRRIPGLNAIDEAVGRATEMGRPVLMVPGLGGLNTISVQALNIFSHISRLAAKFSNPILLCCADAAVYTVAQEMIRDVYTEEGAGDRFDVDSVRFVSDRQFAFAAGVSGLLMREKAAAAFFMGEFYAESLIFAETANSIGAIQVASSTEKTQTPFFIAACDYVLIGDEFYAATAYLTRQPVFVGSLIGQDWCKMAVIFLIAVGALANSVQMGPGNIQMLTTEKKEAKLDQPLKEPREITVRDTFMGHLFKPQKDKEWKVERPKKDKADMPAEGGDN